MSVSMYIVYTYTYMYGGSRYYVQVGTKRCVCGHFQPCTSAQINPTWADVSNPKT